MSDSGAESGILDALIEGLYLSVIEEVGKARGPSDNWRTQRRDRLGRWTDEWDSALPTDLFGVVRTAPATPPPSVAPGKVEVRVPFYIFTEVFDPDATSFTKETDGVPEPSRSSKKFRADFIYEVTPEVAEEMRSYAQLVGENNEHGDNPGIGRTLQKWAQGLGEQLSEAPKLPPSNKTRYTVSPHGDSYAVFDNGKLLEVPESGTWGAAKKIADRLNDSTRTVRMKYQPQLAKDSKEFMSGPEWVVERKWDGMRAIFEIGENDTKIFSRTGQDLRPQFPELTRLHELLPANTILDGEIITLDENGVEQLELLQMRANDKQARKMNQIPATVKFFDVLEDKGEKTTDLNVPDRKERLRNIVGEEFMVETLPVGAEVEDIPTFWEGTMSKLASSKYEVGKRRSTWLKYKFKQSTTMRAVGLTEGKGSRKNSFGAVIVADANGVVRGQVGSGFTEEDIKTLLEANETGNWPLLEIEFRFVSKTGLLTNTAYKGIRTDKDEADVIGTDGLPTALRGPADKIAWWEDELEKAIAADDNDRVAKAADKLTGLRMHQADSAAGEDLLEIASGNRKGEFDINEAFAEFFSPEKRAILQDFLSVRDLKHLKHSQVQRHLRDINKIPDQLLRDVKSSGAKMYVGYGGVPTLDDASRLAEADNAYHDDPRSWDQVAGAYDPSDRGKILMGTGGSGSRSLALHEFGHALGNKFLFDHSPELRAAHVRLYSKLGPYERQSKPGHRIGMQELLAETVAGILNGQRKAAVKMADAEFVSWVELEVLGISSTWQPDKYVKSSEAQKPQMDFDSLCGELKAIDFDSLYNELKAIERWRTQIRDRRGRWADELDTLTPEGSPGGTTGARWFRDGNGNRWVGKSYGGDRERVRAEYLASLIYRDMGVDVPDSGTAEIDGELHVLAREVPGIKGGPMVFQGIYATELREGFIADVLTANYDALGVGPEDPGGNIILNETDRPYRVDLGGTFDFKGMTGRKEFSDDPMIDFEGFQKPGRKHASAIKASQWGSRDKDIQPQLGKLKKLDDERIATLLRRADIDPQSARGWELLGKLSTRRASLLHLATKPKEDPHWAGDVKGIPADGTSRTNYYEKLRQISDDMVLKGGGWADSLSSDEVQSLNSYQGSGYGDLNRLSRGEVDLADPRTVKYLRSQLAHLDRAINKSQLPEDILVHRGAGSSSRDRMIAKFGTDDVSKLKGRVIKQKGYVSTSLDPAVPGKFGNVHLEIKVPKGSRGVFLNAAVEGFEEEAELLLPRGTKLKIVDASESVGGGGTYKEGQRIVTIKAEVVPKAVKPVNYKVDPRRTPDGKLIVQSIVESRKYMYYTHSAIGRSTVPEYDEVMKNVEEAENRLDIGDIKGAAIHAEHAKDLIMKMAVQ